MLSASQALGFILGPAMGLAFYTLDISAFGGRLVIDRNTAPGWISVIFSLLNMLPFLIGYHEDGGLHLDIVLEDQRPLLVDQDTAEDEDRQALRISFENAPGRTMIPEPSESLEESNEDDNVPLMASNSQATFITLATQITDSVPARYDAVAAWIINLEFFLVVLGFSVFETMVVFFTRQAYGWDILENGLLFSACGFMSVVAMLLLKPMQGNPPPNPDPSKIASPRQDDRYYLLAGLALLAMCMVCAYNPFVPPPLPLGQFLVCALILFAPGFPIAQATCFILYSKILGPGGTFCFCDTRFNDYL